MSSLQILARKRVNLVNTGSGTDMSPLRCQVITGTNDELSSTAPRKKNELSTILTKNIKIYFNEINLAMSSGKYFQFCSDIKVLNTLYIS